METNGILRVTYNTQWGHYALHWYGNDGTHLEDDNGEVEEFIRENFCEKYNYVRWFIHKAMEEAAWAINVHKTLGKSDSWYMNFIIEGGYIEDWGTTEKI